MTAPTPDEFRLERDADQLLITHTPTGARFSYSLDAEGGATPNRSTPHSNDIREEADPAVEKLAQSLATRAAEAESTG